MPSETQSPHSGAAAPEALRDLLVEMNDLKRVRSAGRQGSIAERLFAQGWGLLTGGGAPDDVALETMTFEDLGDGRTRLHAFSLCDSFEARDGWLSSGMEVGVHDGYAAIDRLLADGTL